MKKGFTLIELLVVIAIIGILSAVVLTSLNSSRERANDSARKSNIQQAALAMEIERDQLSGNFPMGTNADVVNGLESFNAKLDLDEYTFVENTSSSSVFCLYAQLSDDTYFAASQDGRGVNENQPTLENCLR